MADFARQSFVTFTENKELTNQLARATNYALTLIGYRVLEEAKKIVPQPPGLSKSGRKRTGALLRSMHLSERMLPSGRLKVSIATGRGRNGFHYGAAVEGLIDVGRAYTYTPFLRPSLEIVAPEVPALMREAASIQARTAKLR